MSILTMDKEECTRFNNYLPSGHVDKLKIESDRKSQGDNLTQANSGLSSPHGLARQKREAIQDKLEIAKLATEDDWSHCEDIH